MIPFEEMQQMLSALLDELPAAFFTTLNGGVCLSEDAPTDPDFEELFILGEYSEDPALGCGIVLYYGSFAALFGESSKHKLLSELRATLRHEFRHHLESLAGVDDLDRADAAALLRDQEEDAARKKPRPHAAEKPTQGRGGRAGTLWGLWPFGKRG